jgi:hypothetical protein
MCVGWMIAARVLRYSQLKGSMQNEWVDVKNVDVMCDV